MLQQIGTASLTYETTLVTNLMSQGLCMTEIQSGYCLYQEINSWFIIAPKLEGGWEGTSALGGAHLLSTTL